MNDAPYFSFWAKDWLTGEGTRLMTPEQKGAFIDLLSHAWLSTSEPCTLPSDADSLAKLSGLGRRWHKVSAPIVAQFRPTESGRLRNEKLFTVWSEMEERHGRRVAAGAKGGKAKAEKASNADSNAPAMLKQPKPKPKAKKKDITQTGPAGSDDPGFCAVYDALPKRTGGHDRKTAFTNYRASIAAGVEPQAMLDGAHRYRAFCDAIGRSGTTYVYDAKNFCRLDRELWTDAWDVPLTVSRGASREPEPQYDDPNAPGYVGIMPDGKISPTMLRLSQPRAS